jgi:dipeptidyl aminopeptidase/acylaminoacyl peptidase
MKKIISISLLLLLILIGGVGYFVQQVIAFTPDTEDQVREWRKMNTFENLDWTIEDISFTTFSNSIENIGKPLSISGILIRSDNKNAPTVIALHGKGSNRIGVLRFGYMFYKAGFNVLIYDQRHHGRSEGMFTTYGYYESYDVKAAIQFLESKGINTEKLGIIGESFGAATSIMAGAIEEKLDFVIADSSYIDMPNAVKDNAWRKNFIPAYPLPDMGFAVASVIADFNPWEVSPINSLKNINKPVLIVHCDLDEWAYPKYAYQLYEASNKENTELKMFSDCTHVAAYDDYTEEYENMVQEFLERHAPEFGFSL